MVTTVRNPHQPHTIEELQRDLGRVKNQQPVGERRSMTRQELVEAAWSNLQIEEPTVTREQAERAIFPEE